MCMLNHCNNTDLISYKNIVQHNTVTVWYGIEHTEFISSTSQINLSNPSDWFIIVWDSLKSES